MKAINLKNFRCFHDDTTLEELNRLVSSNNLLMPHQVAVAVGCSLNSALALLLVLSDVSAAKPFLLVYHDNHPDAPPIQKRNIVDGPPQLPFVCDVCGEQIDSRDNLSYDFLFETTDEIRFVVSNNESL